jgi:hypothetical protein
LIRLIIFDRFGEFEGWISALEDFLVFATARKKDGRKKKKGDVSHEDKGTLHC